MGQFVPVFTIRERDVLPFAVIGELKLGLNYNKGILVGAGISTQVLPLTKNSYLNTKLSLCLSFVEQGFLFDILGGKGFISLEKEHTPKFCRKALVVFKKPKNYGGTILYQLENGNIEKLISGKNGDFEEIAMLLPQGKFLKVTYQGIKNGIYYFLYDGRSIRNISSTEKALRDFRRNFWFL